MARRTGLLTVDHVVLKGRPLLVKRSRFGRHGIVPHRLAFHKLTLVIRGAGIMDTAGGSVRLQTHDLTLIQPLVWHAYPAGRERFEVIEVLFDAGLVLHEITPARNALRRVEQCLRSRPTNLQQAIPRRLKLPPDRAAGVLQNMLALYRDERTETMEERDWWQSHRLMLILNDTLAPPTDGPVDVAADTRLNHLLEILTARACEAPPSLAELAATAGWSPTYLSRKFKQQIGMGPIDYIHRVRLEKACQLLTSTDAAIAEIALQTGYDEIPYFNRRFKRLMGQTPTAYRLNRRPA